MLSSRYARGVTDRARLQTELADGFINSFLGHLSVGGPLSTGDGNEARIASSDKVVTDEAFRLGLVGVADERTDTRPGGKDITTADVDFRLEIVLHFVEDPVDLFFTGDWVLRDLARSIGRTSDGVALPGKEEDNTTVRGVRIDQAHV